MQRLVVMLILLTALASPALAQPAITFAGDAVTISGLAPSAKIAWLSIARETNENWVTNVVRREGSTQADAKGELSIAYDSGRSANSGWVAVDVSTGEVAFGSPEGTQWRLVDPTAVRDSAGASGAAHLLQDQRLFLELMLVRPGEGAWGYSVGDGGASDDDRAQDGTIRAAFSALRPVADSASPPSGPRAGDVIVAIDPERLEAYSFRIAQPR